jgi:hypothetical protein
VHELGGGEKFIYARWSGTGKEIYSVTNQGRVVTLDAATGAVVRDEPVPLDADVSRSILAAAFTDDADLQAYSVGRKTSNLYLFRGL